MKPNELKKKVDTIDKKLSKLSLPRGSGSIRWKNKETCYLEYKKVIQYPDGTSKRTTVYGYDIDEVLENMRQKEKDELEKWKVSQIPSSAQDSLSYNNNVIFGDAIKNWFYKFRYLNKRGRSFDREECTLKNQILKYNIAFVELSAVTNIIIQDFLVEIAKKYSYSTVKKTYELINQFFAYYYSRNLNNNPMNLVTKLNELDVKKLSNRTTKEIRFFTPDEIKTFEHEALLTWSNGRPKYKFGVGLIFMMYTGLRFGEATALRWSRIDEENKYINVRTANSYEKVRDENLMAIGGMKKFEDEPKTKAGTRKVYMISQAINYLDKFKQQQNPSSEEEYLFATAPGASPVSYYNLRRAFNLICKNSGIQEVNDEIGLHTLRHTFISMLCRKGVDKMVIAKLVGQSDTEMIERVYYHVMQEEMDTAIKKIDSKSQIESVEDIKSPSMIAGIDVDKIA